MTNRERNRGCLGFYLKKNKGVFRDGEDCERAEMFAGSGHRGEEKEDGKLELELSVGPAM